ncbi:HAD family hydrolase [Elusimicrobiota bacterium]
MKAIIFDIDNTLVDFMRMKRHAVDSATEAMIDAGLPGSREGLKEKIFQVYWKEGIEDQQIFNKVLEQELGKIDFRILAAGIVGYRRAKDAYLSVYPHVHTTLTQIIKMQYKMATVSDAPRLQVWMRLVSLGLAHYFDTVVTFEDTGERKPSSKPFLLALDRLGVKAQDTVMIGDWAERDIVGAKKLGMTTVFARYGDEFNTKESGADYDINDISELVRIACDLKKKTKSKA